MSCCNCTYQIGGCYNVCEDIELTLEGLTDGTYNVNAGFYSFSAVALNEVLTIPANTLNESECVELKIEGYTLQVDGNSYDCFKIKTKYELTASNFVPSNGGGVTPPIADLCSAINACLGSTSEEEPFEQPPFTVLIQNTTYNLNGFGLDFIGAEVEEGVFVQRNFDEFGNDLGGLNNSVGTDCFFNSVFGIDNTIGNNSDFNYIRGVGNSIGNFSSTNIITGANNTIGDSVEYASAFGVSHLITSNLSYILGAFGIGDFEGIGLGNGTDALNRNNSIELHRDGLIKHTGAYANKPTRYTAGGSHTIPDNVSVYIYDPASIQAGATITLPANPVDGQDLYIIGGGTITTGNVITGFTLDGNGRTVIGDGAANLKVGKAYEFHYCGENNIWYAIAF